MRRQRIAGVCVFFVAAVCAGASQASASRIVAAVNNEVVTQKDLDDFGAFVSMELQKQYEGEELQKRLEALRQDLVQKLIEDRLLLQEAAKENVVADEARVRARIQEIKKRFPSEQDFQLSLSAQGMVQADLEKRIREQLTAMLFVDLKVKRGIRINPAEVTKFFEENRSEFVQPEIREFDVVKVDDRQRALTLSAAARAAGNLRADAERLEFEVRRMAVVKGKEFKPDVDEVLFALGEKGISDPIESGGSYYVFELLGVTPERQLSLEEVQERIYGFLLNRKMQESLDKLLQQLKAKAYIRTF